ncbi:MAG TPA: hypothetical protein PL188_01310 [Candidatus Cloacimonadota bacterium]|nr:hypothetical protein [Candidatus Cloacimonadota bacterium]
MISLLFALRCHYAIITDRMGSDSVFSTGAMYRRYVPALAVAPFGFYHRESRDKVEEWKGER